MPLPFVFDHEEIIHIVTLLRSVASTDFESDTPGKIFDFDALEMGHSELKK